MRTLLYLLAGLAILYAGLTYYFGGVVISTPNRDATLAETYEVYQERWNINLDSLDDVLPAPEEVTFTSPVDAITLSGWYYAQDSSDCAVIFLHGYSENRVGTIKYTPYFWRRGCDLFLYDHRGFGRSEEAYASGGYYESADLTAAHAYVRERSGLPDDRIGWLGESWGAATALIAAGRFETPDPGWVIAESPYADWEMVLNDRGVAQYGSWVMALTPGAFAWAGSRVGIDTDVASPRLFADQIDEPVLLFHSQQDEFTNPRQSDLIAKNVDPKLLTYHKLNWGAGHTRNIVANREKYEELVEDFLNKAMSEGANE